MADKKNVVMIRATVERTSPDRVQWKPYATDLTFDGKLEIEIPVPADEVIEQKGGKTVLTVEGFATLLRNYVVPVERMNEKINNEKFGLAK